ncbi:hypothetical protein BH23DEI1_BH23DEI1_05580 [soil metagenome]|nr:hypothetical protein [Trueperaceae bacterium]
MTLTLHRPWVRSPAKRNLSLTAALALPLLVHLVPVHAGPPPGARLVPIISASLVLALRAAVPRP